MYQYVPSAVGAGHEEPCRRVVVIQVGDHERVSEREDRVVSNDPVRERWSVNSQTRHRLHNVDAQRSIERGDQFADRRSRIRCRWER